VRAFAQLEEARVRLGAAIDARCDAELVRCRRDAQRARRSLGQRFKRKRKWLAGDVYTIAGVHGPDGALQRFTLGEPRT
jgi:glutathione S-transferase